MVSYAESWADVRLDRAFAPDHAGFYVEIGGGPVEGSVTKHFHDLGWRGIDVNPASATCSRLRDDRPRDVVLNLDLTDGTAQTAPVEEPLATLADIFAEHVEGDIDLLAVGADSDPGQVVGGGDWRRWRPRIVIIAAPGGAAPSADHEAWEKVLLDADYLFAAFDGMNRYYVRSEDDDLAPKVAVPVNSTDDFVPFEHVTRLKQLTDAIAELLGQITATRVANESMRSERESLVRSHYELLEGLRELQASQETTEVLLENTREQYLSIRAVLAETRARYEHLRMEMANTQAQAVEVMKLIEGVGPSSLGIARRLGRLGGRFPRTAVVGKRTLRLALSARRRLSARG